MISEGSDVRIKVNLSLADFDIISEGNYGNIYLSKRNIQRLPYYTDASKANADFKLRQESVTNAI